MKKLVVLIMALFVTTPAFAWTKVTNLTDVPQSVTFSRAGSDETRIIAPNATEAFQQGDGMLALNGAAAKAKAHNAKPGPLGAILGDLVAANRTERIPAKNGSQFVIWPDGRMMLQRHMHRGGVVF